MTRTLGGRNSGEPGPWARTHVHFAARVLGLAVALAPPAVARADSPPAPAQEAVIAPPPLGKAYIQFGIAFTVETVMDPGPICANAAEPCILGSGAGISMRSGWRPTENLYLGGAYEFSKQEPSKLYRLGILPQADR